MKFTKKILTENLKKQPKGVNTFTDGKKQNVVLSEEQLDRLLASIQEQWQVIELGEQNGQLPDEPVPAKTKEVEEGEKPDFLDLDKDGNKKESMKKAAKDMKEDSGHDEAINYGEDEGHDDKELYDLKHDDGSEDHIDDLEDDMHYDDIHDSENIEESRQEKERLIKEDIKKMKQIISPIKKI
tara:strand:+ start:2387 stop:2935 length:549 start_codon:yes stop_codon:yes gene_type:complete